MRIKKQLALPLLACIACIACILLLAEQLQAALPASTFWELRPTVGSDVNNSGCFDQVTSAGSGTDYSQQNANQYAGIDLVAATATHVTSVAHSFVATDQGNCLVIRGGAGWTVGYYMIVTTAAGEATLDRSPAVMGTVAGSYAVGGALATCQQLTTVGAGLGIAPNNTAYMKATGPCTMTSALTINASASSVLNPLSFIGYAATRGDTGRVSWTTATNAINMVVNVGQNGAFLFENIDFSSTAVAPGPGWTENFGTNDFVTFNNCRVHGFSTGIKTDDTIANLFLQNSEIDHNATGVGDTGGGFVAILGSYFHDMTANVVTDAALQRSAGRLLIYHSIFNNNAGNNIRNASGGNGNVTFLLDAAVINAGRDGFRTSGGNPAIISWNTVYMGNGAGAVAPVGGFGVDSVTFPSPGVRLLHTGGFLSNASGAYFGVTQSTDDINLGVDPFVNVAGDNFALNNTPTGGAFLRTTGYPGTLTIGGTGFSDVGPLQTSGGGGGGGTCPRVLLCSGIN